MADDAPGMKSYRTRNEDGGLRRTRSAKHAGILKEQHGIDFGVRSDMHVGTLLQQHGVSSVSELLKRHTGQQL